MSEYSGTLRQSVSSVNVFGFSGIFFFLLGYPLFLHPVTTTSIQAPVSELQIDTLPVVMHVIHTGTPVGSPDNPSDNLIHDMIDLMNNAFQKNGPMYGGADIQLEFKLAVRTPECETPKGINRIDGSIVPNYKTGGITTDLMIAPQSAHELYVKELSRWPNTDYINIWIVNMIDGDPHGLAGYTHFPEYNSALTDGIVIRADVVNGTNKTIIHELGHYFSLHHTFGLAGAMCLSESDCSADGDLICDTENCNFTTVCTATTNPCTGDPWLIADFDQGYTVLNNYMGYTDCQWMFTDEQKDRMHDALETFRPGLLSSQALQMSAGSPAAACLPDALNGLSDYYGIERVEFGSLDVYSNSSMADGAFYIDRTCNQVVKVSPGENVFVRITGSYTNHQQIKVFLDYDNDGVFEAPDELLLSGNAGVLQATITIPSDPISICNALRLRVITDNPNAPEVTPCLLTGTPQLGVGQIEDYTVVIGLRQIESISSGDWNDPSIWSCNCIPSAGDAVLIHSGHVINVLQNEKCGYLELRPGANMNVLEGMHVFGGCQ